MSKPTLMASGLLVAAFVAGAVIGSAGFAWAERTETKRREKPGYVERLQMDLDLVPHQRAMIEELTEHYDMALRRLWREVRPRADSIREQTRSDIAALLDEEQRRLYEAFNARIDSSRAADRKRHDDEDREE